MALPTLSANSPSPGYISWTSFSIAYGGVQRTIPAGNTGKRYVYWLWNAGNPAAAVQTADVLPTNLTADDLVLFANRQGIPINVQSANVIEGSLIATESIIGDSIAANTIKGDSLLADTLTAREIKAGAITANELSLSSYGGVQAVNGDMEDVDPVTKVPAGWTAGFERSGTAPVYSQDTMQPLSGTTSCAITLAANSVEGMAAKATPVKAGDKIMFGTAFRTNVTGVPITLRAYFGTTPDFTASQLITATPATPENVYIYDITAGGFVPRNDGPAPLSGAGIAAIADGWLTPVTTGLYITGQVEVPTGARFVRFVLASGLPSGSPAHTTTWDALEYLPVITSIHMADGAIEARHLTADAIDGKVINGVEINGGTFTGGLFQTASAGQRWKLDSSAVNVFSGYTNDPAESLPGQLFIDAPAGGVDMIVGLNGAKPTHSGINPSIWLRTSKTNSGTAIDNYGLIEVSAGRTDFSGGVRLTSTRPGDGLQVSSMTPLQQREGTGKTTTTSTYTPTAATVANCGLSFVAPPSGTINIQLSALLRSQVAGKYVRVDYQIREGATIGAGNVVYSGDTGVSTCMIATVSVDFHRGAGVGLHTGLTPGQTYNIFPVMASHDGVSNVSVAGTRLVVTPCL